MIYQKILYFFWNRTYFISNSSISVDRAGMDQVPLKSINKRWRGPGDPHSFTELGFCNQIHKCSKTPCLYKITVVVGMIHTCLSDQFPEDKLFNWRALICRATVQRAVKLNLGGGSWPTSYFLFISPNKETSLYSADLVKFCLFWNEQQQNICW